MVEVVFAGTVANPLNLTNIDTPIEEFGASNGKDTCRIENVVINNYRKAMVLKRFAAVYVKNVQTIAGSRQVGEQSAQALICGSSSTESFKVRRTYVDGCNFAPLESPSSDYANFNQDNCSLERFCTSVFIKDSLLLGATDGVIDAKVPVKMVRCTIGPSYLQLRMWDGVEFQLADVVLLPNPTTTQGNFQTWAEDFDNFKPYLGGDQFFDDPAGWTWEQAQLDAIAEVV